MACAQCGSASAADTASCVVCNPWATPKEQTSDPAGAGLPKRTAARKTAPELAGLPAWLKAQIRTNPPAEADLDKAWLATVRHGRATLAFYVLICVCSVLMAAGDRVGYLLFFLVLIGYGIVSQRSRRTTWLPKAVAVVGTRPDIGYQRFVRIPAVVRLTTLNKVVLPAITVFFIVRLVTMNQQSVPEALNIGLWLLIWVMAASTSGISYALQARARKDLDRLLAARVVTRA
jgi:hypothetical protein